MLESLVASILNRVLGSYVENFDPKQLQIGLLSGDVKLGGLRLKRGALDQLQLPIDVVNGHIGSLILQIPYSNLKSKPVKIFIEDVFIIARPDTGHEGEGQKRREQAAKLEKLQAWEVSSERAITRSSSNTEAEAEEREQQQNFTTPLVTKIIENLQVTIRNIHIRLEDSEVGVAMGATLGELSALSTNKDWEPAFIADVGSKTHKLATLDSLAFYIDRDFAIEFSNPSSFETEQELLEQFKLLISDSVGASDVLRPINGQGFITLNKKPESEKVPKIQADLKFEELSMNLERGQYVDIIRLTEQFQKFFNNLKYRLRRPKETIKENPLAWFRYAANTVLDGVKERRRCWTWEYIKQRLDDQKKYVDLYKKWYHAGGNVNGLNAQEKNEFNRIQSFYNYDDIVFFRSLAKKSLVNEHATRKDLDESKRQQQNQTWSEWLWGSKSTDAGSSADSTLAKSSADPSAPIRITDQQRQELLDVLDIPELHNDAASQILLAIGFSLRSAGIRLKAGGRDIASAGFEGVSTTFVNRPDSFAIEMSIDKFSVSDLTHKNQFSDIIRVQNLETLNSNKPFFWFLFEHHPADRKADSNLFLKSQSVVLVHNARLMESVINFFATPPDQFETVEAILMAANRTVEDLREQTRIGLEYALENHKTLNLQLDIKAPTIIIPFDTSEEDSPAVVLDVGSMEMASDLVPHTVINEVKSKQALKYGPDDWKRLESLMYDRFTIKLYDTQVLLAESMSEIKKSLNQDSSKYHFLDKTTLQFLLELSIVPKNHSITRSRVSIQLPSLRATLADVQYILFMKIINAATPNTDFSNQVHSDLHHKRRDSVLDKKVGETEIAKTKQDLKSKTEAHGNSGSPQKLFELVLTVNEVRFFLVRGWDAKPLIDMCLHDISVTYFNATNQPTETLGVDIVVRDLLITDHICSNGSPDLRKIAESDGHKENSSSEKLFDVCFRKSESGDMSVAVNLEAMRFSLNPDTVLVIYDYIMSTFTSPQDNSNVATIKETPDDQKSLSSSHSISAVPEKDKIEVQINMNKITAVLSDNNESLASLSLESATMSVELTDRIKFQMQLGILSIVDNFEQPLLGHEEGSHLADFRYETSPPLEDGITPSGPASVYLRLGKVRLSILEEPLTRLVSFSMRFTTMKAAYDQARMMAFNQAIQVEPGMFQFDVSISTPVILWPQKEDWIRLNLGEVTLINEFKGTENTLKAEISNVKVTSLLSAIEQEIVPTTSLKMKLVHTPDSKDKSLPVTVVRADLSPIHFHSTEFQYRFIMQFIAALTRISAGTVSASPGMDEVGNLRRQLAKDKKLEEKQASYWWGENFSVSLGPSNTLDSEVKRPQLSFVFEAPLFDITLELNSKPISRFAIKEIVLEAEVDSKSQTEANFHIKSFSADDLSDSDKNMFSQIIPSIKHDGFQVMGRVLQRVNQPLNVECSVDSPQVIIALEYMILLKKFLEFGNIAGPKEESKEEFDESDHSESDDSESDEEDDLDTLPPLPGRPGPPALPTRPHSNELVQDSDESGVASTDNPKSMIPIICINIVDMYLTVLADESDKNSEAAVFKIEQFIVNTGETSSITFSKVGMFLTRMEEFDTSKLRVLDDFSVTASVDTSGSTSALRLANIKLNMDRLVLRISLREILLLLDIATKASGIWETNSENSIANDSKSPNISGTKKSANFFSDDHRVVHNGRLRPGRINRRDSNSSAHEAVINARVLSEQLTAQFDGIRVVLIDPIHQLPIIDLCLKPFTLVAKNWSDSLIVNARAELFANAHSFTKSAWEPLVDIMEIGLEVTKDAIEVFSDTLVDIELTPETLELAEDIQGYFTDPKSSLAFQRNTHDDGAPYRIRNETGVPLTIWADSNGNGSKRRKLQNTEEIKWSFHNWRELRENLNATDQDNSLGVEIEGYEMLRSIPVSSIGEYLHILKNDEVKSRIVFDVWVENHLKYVSIRSTCVLRNHTDTSLEVMMVNATNTDLKDIILLDPYSSKPLPLAFVDSYLLVRQYGSRVWPDKSLHWSDLRNYRNCTLKCNNDFAVAITPEIPDDKLSKVYPYMYINISVPFQIVNNLPIDIDIRLYSRDTRRETTRSLAKAGRSLVYDYSDENLLLLKADVPGYYCNKFAVVNASERFSREFHIEDTLDISHGSHKVQLKIDYVDLPRGEGRLIVIYSPYVIVNSSDREILLSGKLNRAVCSPNSVALWSFNSINHNSRQRVTFATIDSHTSSPASLDASGSNLELVLPSKDRQKTLYLGAIVIPGAGRYVNTKVVTVSPRFILCNSLDRPTEFMEPGGSRPLKANAFSRVPVGFISAGAGKEFCIRLTDSDRAEWSSSFTMSNVGTSHVRILERGKPTLLAKIEIILEGATLFVHIRKADSWPFSIRNFTNHEFKFHQTDPLIDADGDEIGEHSKDQFTPVIYRLPPRSVMPYSWDFPAASVKQLVLEPSEATKAYSSVLQNPTTSSANSFVSTTSTSKSGIDSSSSLARSGLSSTHRKNRHKVSRRKVQLAEIGELPPANFGDGLIVNLSVIADGRQQALVIADYNPLESDYDVRTNKVKAEALEEVEAIEANSGRMFRLRLMGIGISCITPSAQELVYITLRNLKVGYHVSDALETISVQVQWIQVDNSLPGSSDFPVLVYPTVLPKAAEELAAHPCFSASTTRVRDDSHGLAYIKHATLLLQEMTIEADEDFMLNLVDLVISLTTNKGTDTAHKKLYQPLRDDNSILCDGKIHVPEPSSDTTPDIYFEQLHLQPIQLNLSFVRTGSLSSSSIFKVNNVAGGLAFIIDALTLTIGNVNNAPLRFNALLVDNVRTPLSNLVTMFQMHYQQEFLYQLHKILGSADVIGNPVGLFNNISSGVMDLFYEPYLGYTLHDRPQEFGVGLAKGGLSFMKKSVFGVSDSISKVTGSLSKGLAVMTLDPRYQSQQRTRRTRNRPKHAGLGFKYGFESFYESISSGVVGLAEAPMQGAITDGGSGFFKGLGVGLLGLPTKTTIGFLDLASNISEGIRNTTKVFDAHEITRVRLPRVIFSDGVIRPYNMRESVGQMILHTVKDGRYAHDQYLAHSNITPNKVVVVSVKLLMVASINNMKLEWSLSYSQIKLISNESTGIAITLLGDAHGPFIPLSDQSARQYIYKNIAKGVDEYNRRRLLLSQD